MHDKSAGKPIASGLVATVLHCADCNILHLELGAFTLRIRPSAAHDLRDTLSRALAALPAQAKKPAAQRSATAHTPDGICH